MTTPVVALDEFPFTIPEGHPLHGKTILTREEASSLIKEFADQPHMGSLLEKNDEQRQKNMDDLRSALGKESDIASKINTGSEEGQSLSNVFNPPRGVPNILDLTIGDLQKSLEASGNGEVIDVNQSQPAPEAPKVIETSKVIEPTIVVTDPTPTSNIPRVTPDGREIPFERKPVAFDEKIEMSEKTRQRYEKLAQSGKNAIDFLMDYVNVMRPKKPLAVATAVQYQGQFYRCLQRLINNDGDNFAENLTAVLRLLEEFDEWKEGTLTVYGAFHDRYVFRFMDRIELPKEDRTAFVRIVNFLKILGPVKGRELARGQVSAIQSLKYGVSAEGAERLQVYFGLTD